MEAKTHSVVALPLTFGGVASLARDARRQLRVYRPLVALLAAASLGFFFEIAWVPAVNRTIVALPSRGFIRYEEVTQVTPAPVHEPGTGFLSVTVDVGNTGAPGDEADLQIRFQH